MPRSRSDDRSPGDAREPYSELGGPAGRHAQTHDVRREELTNPTGPEPRDESFDADLGGDDPGHQGGGHEDESFSAAGDKRVQSALQELDPDELKRLSVLEAGTDLEQGAVYLDVADRQRGPFKAIGGQHAEPGSRLVAKRDTDYELWNRLVGDDKQPDVVRPTDQD